MKKCIFLPFYNLFYCFFIAFQFMSVVYDSETMIPCSFTLFFLVKAWGKNPKGQW